MTLVVLFGCVVALCAGMLWLAVWPPAVFNPETSPANQSLARVILQPSPVSSLLRGATADVAGHSQSESGAGSGSARVERPHAVFMGRVHGRRTHFVHHTAGERLVVCRGRRFAIAGRGRGREFPFLTALESKLVRSIFSGRFDFASSRVGATRSRPRGAAYAWADETLWNQGLKTAAEIELRLKCLTYGADLSPIFLAPLIGRH